MTPDPNLSPSSKTPLALSPLHIASSIRPPAVGPQITPSEPLTVPTSNRYDSATVKIKNDFLMFGCISVIQTAALIGRGTCVVRATVVEDDPNEWGREILQDITRTMNSNRVEFCTFFHRPAFPMDAINAQCQPSKYLTSRNINCENRVLQLLAMTELFQMTDMTANTLIPVIKDVFKCYKWAYKTAGVIHRDISENNIMYWKKADGTICGFLSDFDLSSTLTKDELGPSSKHQMGTPGGPFLALDLLEPIPIKHLYRHDLESLFYIIIILMFRSKGEKVDNFRALEEWFTLPPAQLLDKKKSFLAHTLPLATPNFQKLDVLAVNMKTMFDDGYRARARHAERTDRLQNPAEPAFDEPTLGAHVDFDKFEEILDSV